eukprot:Plantae.Rhodophyta-Rhodochaete_pulchella.ctg4260.p1 GENE.Plantae.Rhodophyta-Rhodochaete_pulchella.ctg4260~~Plantae.Rhodophyta-Rhodochaete_pulchella.ctg4260.p1  ORF type:complete len:586 (+),score=91.01 Plantae.Rhodophyta-Rhodochaete_pulchella.ctg4260:79-1758(+)
MARMVDKAAKEAEKHTDDGGKGATASTEPAHARVVDMRDGNPVEMPDITAALSRSRIEPRVGAVAVPELLHNLRLIVDLTIAEGNEIEQRQRNETARSSRLRQEIAEVEKVLDDARKRMHLQHSLRKELQRLQEVRSISEVLSVARNLYSSVPDEKQHARFDVSETFIAFASPVALEAARSGSEAIVQSMIELRKVLPADVYTRLAVQGVLPAFRRHFSSKSWNPRDPDHTIRWLESWNSALPDPVARVLVDQVMLPRLDLEVTAWKPRSDPVPVHSWLFAWLPLLGKQKLAPLFRKVLRKFSAVMTTWRASDESATKVVAPWKSVCREDDFHDFLKTTILPKLKESLKLKLKIVPGGECSVQALDWALRWDGIVESKDIGMLMFETFFPLWLNATLAWLREHRPGVDELTEWYSLSKSWFPAHLIKTKGIGNGLNAGLDVINAVLSDEDPSHLQADALLARRRPKSASLKPRPSAVVAGPVEASEASLKELLSHQAELENIEFAPTPSGRTHLGNTVYSFGGILVFVDNKKQLVYSQEGRSEAFKPTSIEELIARAKI